MDDQYVVNLSVYTLSSFESNLLRKGLSFVPTKSYVKLSDYRLQLMKINRKILLHDFFHNKVGGVIPYDPNLFKNKFILPSHWIPPKSSSSGITLKCLEIVDNELMIVNKGYEEGDDLVRYHIKDNLATDERNSIQLLKNNLDIIIKPADKGGAIVIMDTSLYNSEAYKQLSDSKYYKPISNSISDLNIVHIDFIMGLMLKKGFINSKQYSYFTNHDGNKPRYFYLLPKIHKHLSTWSNPKMPAGRPIVGCCGSELHSIGQLIDHYLQPFCKIQKSYTKDSYHFISKIKNSTINSSSLLVTGDITSLYTNMRHDIIINSIKELFLLYPDETRPDRFIIELLHLTLTGNDFCFEGKWFLQILGMAMGNPCSPSTANLFLEAFDQALLSYNLMVSLYNRFLDDTFFVWSHSITELLLFESFLNTVMPNIKISFVYSYFEVNFLDVTIYKYISNGSCTLQTKPYFKVTDTHQLLHKKSFHPKHVFVSIIKSQFIRLKRLSSFRLHYLESSRIVVNALLKRGYSKRLLRQIKNDIWFNFKDKIRIIKPDNIIPLVLTHGPVGLRTSGIYKESFKNNPIFNGVRFISAYTINKNLGSLLSRSKY